MTNPIVEQGLVLSEQEYEVLCKVVVSMAQQAKDKNIGAYEVLRRILGRMGAAQRKGTGVRPEDLEIYQRRIHAAFASQDGTALSETVEDLVASTLRCDADPGQRVAKYLLQTLSQVVEARALDGHSTLDRLVAQLDEATADWNAQNDWPSGADVMAWIRDLIEVGRDNLERGDDPWPAEDEP